MKLLVFSDIHGDRAALERAVALEADVYIAAGDLTSWGRGLDGFGDLLATRAGRMFVLPGNHESADMIEAFCERFGLHALHGRSIEREGFHIAGLGYSTPTPFNTPGEYTEEEMAERLLPFAGLNPLILICHCPPHATALDLTRDGAHAGSRAVARFIQEHQPKIFVSGHIHEAAGTVATLGQTRAFSAGPLGCLIEVP